MVVPSLITQRTIQLDAGGGLAIVGSSLHRNSCYWLTVGWLHMIVMDKPCYGPLPCSGQAVLRLRTSCVTDKPCYGQAVLRTDGVNTPGLQDSKLFVCCFWL